MDTAATLQTLRETSAALDARILARGNSLPDPDTDPTLDDWCAHQERLEAAIGYLECRLER